MAPSGGAGSRSSGVLPSSPPCPSHRWGTRRVGAHDQGRRRRPRRSPNRLHALGQNRLQDQRPVDPSPGAKGVCRAERAAAAICLWAALLDLLSGVRPPTRSALRVAVAGSVAAASRPLSPVFVCMVVAITVLITADPVRFKSFGCHSSLSSRRPSGERTRWLRAGCTPAWPAGTSATWWPANGPRSTTWPRGRLLSLPSPVTRPRDPPRLPQRGRRRPSAPRRSPPLASGSVCR